MAFVVLTRRNIAAIKQSLMSAFPQVGSGHADESIAAGFGYRTHAALLASLKAQGNARITVLLNETAVGQRLRDLAGIEPEGEAWMAIWRQTFTELSDALNLDDWWKHVANEN